MKTTLKRVNGALKIDVDGKVYPPLAFKSFRPNDKNISEFYQAGVRLFTVLSSGITSALGVPYSLFGETWVGEKQYDFSALDKQMDMFIANAPDAYFAPMIQLDTRDWYLALHPEVPNSFTSLSQIACDEKWKTAAADYMKATIRHCEKKYGEKIFGYFLLCGTTTEWFSGGDYEASHPIKEKGYKKWRGDDSVTLPSMEQLNKKGNVFLDPMEENVYYARKFHAEIIADLILYFTGDAQKVLDHKKLLGIYYGYLFELGGERLFNDGSLAYEKVFLSEHIDMISSPSSYAYRGIDSSSAFMVTQKTLDIHNKLYFLEFDHITHTAPESIEEGCDKTSENRRLTQIPGADGKCKNELETLNLMYRDFILCNSHMVAMWWFDMFDGWFRSEAMMNAVQNMVNITDLLSEKNVTSVAEVAVFAEGESMYRVRKSSDLATVCLSDIRRTLGECGVAYDLYSIGDIENIENDSYKLYIFLNQYDLPDATMEYIYNKVKKSGKTILWMYAPGYVNQGVLSGKRLSQIVGMNIISNDVQPGRLLYKKECVDYPLAAPYFSVFDNTVNILSCFENGTVAAAWKEIEGYKSVYVAACNLPAELLRDIAKIAGVFVYSDVNKVYVYPNSNSIGVYNGTDQDANIHVPQSGIYRDLICGEMYKTENNLLNLYKRDMRAFLLVLE